MLENNRRRTRKRQFINWLFIFEVILIAVHPLPYIDYSFSIKSVSMDKKTYVDVWYRVSDFLLLFMFLRLLLLIRTIFNYTMFTDLYAKRLW